ncbi:MAG: class I tRNA ligase family protein [Proteobacteria bacterium]|nr:class I tRNA ligase family protein [Pseudomonadota bacterium]
MKDNKQNKQDGEWNYSRVTEDIQAYWREQDIFAKTLSQVDDNGKVKPEYIFYEGPPSANGSPGIHHMMARTIKDVFCRYKTLLGYHVPRTAGWDAHGLPVELSVEKELGITKEDIGHTVSVATFNQKCRESVGRYLKEWELLTEKMGYWVDLDQAYMTCAPKYMETLWWLIAKIHQLGYLYQGYSIQPYSPVAGTALSSHELNQPGCYRQVKDLSCVVQFPLCDQDKKVFTESLSQHGVDQSLPIYFLAWTTTPWTLPANCALCVHGDVSYQLIGTWQKHSEQRILVLLAEDCISSYFGQQSTAQADHTTPMMISTEQWLASSFHEQASVLGAPIATFKGKALLGLSYIPPFTHGEELSGKFHSVVADDFVTTDDGTGIVHLAPCYGADDLRVCTREGIGAIDIVTDEGCYTDCVPGYEGRYIKQVYKIARFAHKDKDLDCDNTSLDVDLVTDLKKRGLLFRSFKIEHSYPHCWRTDAPIFYRPVKSWFIQTTAIKEKLLSFNQQIHWYPKSTGTARFADWLENLVDWNLSRTRYWGTPLPIWSREGSDEYLVIGSLSQLQQEIQKSVELGYMKDNFLRDFTPDSDQSYSTLDLHRTVLDKIILTDSLGQPLTRENDVIDVWFDSGAMPYATAHYPFAGGDGEQEREHLRFPADFIAEGVDQTRGWFFALHVIGVMCFDSIAFKHVVANGLVLDKDGQKMSKRLGNTIDPFDLINRFGADIVRWYMLANAKPWENLKFDIKGLKECQQKFFNTLTHTYQFFDLYARHDNYQITNTAYVATSGESLGSIFDRWLISELHSLIKGVKASLDVFDPTTAARLMQNFTLEKLSNWYVRCNRRRFWKNDHDLDKGSAYQSLWQALYTISHLMAPLAPMMADRLYLDLIAHMTQDNKKELNQKESVHLSQFPEYQKPLIDSDLEDRMNLARQVTSLILSLREKAKIRVRQPLKYVYIVDFTGSDQQASVLTRLHTLVSLICTETNVKEVVKIDPSDPALSRRVKPNFYKLGKRLGKNMSRVKQLLTDLSSDEVTMLERGEASLTLRLSEDDPEQSVQIFPEDVIVTYDSHDKLLMGSQGDLTVGLSTEIDEQLAHEGMIRELVNRIQNQRKALGLKITDKVTVVMSDHPKVVQALSADNRREYLMMETLATQVETVTDQEMPELSTEHHFDRMSIKLWVTKTEL